MTKQRIILTGALFACLVFVTAACTAPVPGLTAPGPVTGQTPQSGSASDARTAQAEAFKAGAPAATAPARTEPPQPSPTAASAMAASVTAAPPTAATLAAQATPAAEQSGQAVKQAAMRDELFLAGAPAFALFPRCLMPESLPVGERAATWTSTYDSGLLCLFGFGEGETVQYKVRDAGGEVADSGEGQPDNLDGDPLPSVKVLLSIGGRAPGAWSVTATAASGELTATFTAQPKTLDGQPAIVLALAGGRSKFTLGESVGIAAYGLPDAATPQLGVYSATPGRDRGLDLKLHEAASLDVDAGAAFVTLTFDPTYTAGDYCLVLQATTDYEPAQSLSTQGATRCFEVQ